VSDGHTGPEVGHPDANRNVVGSTDEFARLPDALGPLPLRGVGVIGAPGRDDRERFHLRRQLESQPHGRRNHKAALGPGVLGRVLIGVGRRVVRSRHRHTRAQTGILGRARLDILLRRGRRGRDVGEPPRRDPADRVHSVRRNCEHLMVAIHRAEQLPGKDVSQILAGRPGRPVRLRTQLVR